MFLTAKLLAEDPAGYEEAARALLARLRVESVDLLLLPLEQFTSAESLQVPPFPQQTKCTSIVRSLNSHRLGREDIRKQ